MARRHFASRVLNFVVMPVLALFMLFPIAWMFAVSLKTEAETYNTPLTWIPNSPTLVNYVTIWQEMDFGRYFQNTLIVAGLTTALAIVVAAPAGYAVSRFRFRGRDAFSGFLLASQMFPRVILIVPYFITMRVFGLVNTFTALVLIYVAFAVPFCIWMLRGHYASVPMELDEAAILDGCSPFQVFRRIVLPLILPGVVATAVFAFLVAWNEFLFALVLATDRNMSVITVGLASLIGEYKTQWNELMAATIVGSLPAMFLYAVLERYLIRGLSSGATKG